MKIGIVKEIKNNEYRVAVVPSGVAEFIRREHEVFVEHDAGSGNLYDDIEIAVNVMVVTKLGRDFQKL